MQGKRRRSALDPTRSALDPTAEVSKLQRKMNINKALDKDYIRVGRSAEMESSLEKIS